MLYAFSFVEKNLAWLTGLIRFLYK